METNIIKKQQTMTSLEIAELTGKQHNDVLKAIRKMEPAWEKVCQGKFSLWSYADAKRPVLPLTPPLIGVGNRRKVAYINA